MTKTRLALALALALPACDSGPPPASANAAADAKAKEDAEYEARMKERAAKREAEAEAAKKAEEDLKTKIDEVTVIPEGTKIPKKAKEACDQVVEAQRGFMKKFHGDIEEAALTTQLGLLAKQCNDMNKPKIAMCQKFALDATTEELSPKINEYLPVCMSKYGAEDEGKGG